MTPIRILITGSRDWWDAETITNALDEYTGAPHVVLVSGACPTGADKICEAYAETVGWEIERHPANWKLYGKQAGPVRNSEMVHLGADICVAFIKNQSNGATMTAELARKAKIKTLIFQENDDINPKKRSDCE